MEKITPDMVSRAMRYVARHALSKPYSVELAAHLNAQLADQRDEALDQWGWRLIAGVALLGAVALILLLWNDAVMPAAVIGLIEASLIACLWRRA